MSDLISHSAVAALAMIIGLAVAQDHFKDRFRDATNAKIENVEAIKRDCEANSKDSVCVMVFDFVAIKKESE